MDSRWLECIAVTYLTNKSHAQFLNLSLPASDRTATACIFFFFLRLKTWTTNSKIADLVTENVLQLELIVSYFKHDSSVTNGVPDNSTQDCLQHSSTGETVLKSLVYFIIIVLSLVGNGYILLVIYKNKNLRRNINFFVLNMAVSDLFNPLIIMPVHLVVIIKGSPSWRVDNPWILGNILYKLCYFLPDVTLTVSIESLLLIAADRFIAAVFPLKARHFSTKVHLVCIGCTWIIAIAVHAPYFYTFRLFPYGSESYQWTCIQPHRNTQEIRHGHFHRFCPSAHLHLNNRIWRYSMKS